jgi:hypothetical protein
MNLDQLNDLPEWEDDDEFDRLGEDIEGEAWKPNPTRDACKAMYKKWNEIIIMLNGALVTEEENEADEDAFRRFTKEKVAIVLGDAFEAGAKIRSSEAGSMYVLRMENAAIIRKNAQYVKTAMLGFRAEGVIDETYCAIIRNEIDAFRGLFKEWIATFTKDEYEDEWGLFV